MATRIRKGVLAGALGVFLGMAAQASASTVTVGDPLTSSFTGGGLSCDPIACTLFNSALGEAGAHLTSPVSGTIVRWRMMGTASNGGAFELVVLRPTGGGQYTAVETSSPMVPSGTGPSTFATDLPIKAGDTIGIDTPDATWDNGFTNAVAGSTFSDWEPPLAVGSTSSPSGPQAGEVGFNADVVPVPSLVAVGPASGPSSGGTRVVIKGKDLTGTTEVTFGGVPSSHFTVDSDRQITAIAPRPAGPGTVYIAVTTPGGRTRFVAAARFTYTTVRCLVPNLRGDTLRETRTSLGAAHCTLGIVAKPPHRTNLVVVSQSPAPGTALARGGSVSVRLGPKH